MTATFPDPIKIHGAYMSQGVRWFIIADRFRQNSSYGKIETPPHFHSDGASIPKAFHSIVHPFGEYFGAALIHDYLYTIDGADAYPHLTRKDADEIFLEGMKDLGVPWYHRHPMHRAVALFGWRSYKKR